MACSIWLGGLKEGLCLCEALKKMTLKCPMKGRQSYPLWGKSCPTEFCSMESGRLPGSSIICSIEVQIIYTTNWHLNKPNLMPSCLGSLMAISSSGTQHLQYTLVVSSWTTWHWGFPPAQTKVGKLSIGETGSGYCFIGLVEQREALAQCLFSWGWVLFC